MIEFQEGARMIEFQDVCTAYGQESPVVRHASFVVRVGRRGLCADRAVRTVEGAVQMIEGVLA